MSDSELIRLFAMGFIPALTVTAIGVQFFKHYLALVNEYITALERKIKTIIRGQFLEALEEGRPGIRDTEDATLPLKYIRDWGLRAYRRQYYKVAVWKCGVSSVAGALFWFGSFALGYAFGPSASVSAVAGGYAVTLDVATVASALRKASIVLALLFAFFGFTILLRFEVLNDETSIPHPKD